LCDIILALLILVKQNAGNYWRINMKKIIAGIGFEITGTLMLLLPSLIASISLENTTEWNTQLGRYLQTIFNLGLLPVIIIGSVLLITGIIFSLWGTFSKSGT